MKQRLLGFLLLFTVPTFAIQPQPFETIPEPNPWIQRLYTDDHILSYDAILELLEQIENGDLDSVCSDEDWQQIGEFLALLATQGTLPNASEIEKAELQRDILDLSTPSSTWECASYYLGSERYCILPALYLGDANAILCKGWIHKKWNHVKHFVKHHKTAVIVGTVLVVAAVAVVATVAVASATAAAAAGTTTAAATQSSSKEKVRPTDPAVNDQVQVLKTTADQNQLLSPIQEGDASIIGSILAHDAIQSVTPLPSLPPSQKNPFEQVITAGHGVIDKAFSTESSIQYIHSNPFLEDPTTRIQKNVFQQQGEISLQRGNYEQAVVQFGKAIEADPSHPDIYLDRAYTYLKMEDYDHSLADYRTYISKTPPKSTPSPCIDFCIGFVTNINTGAIDSGRELVCVASELVRHPIDTTGCVCEAYANLADMAASREWKALSQSVAPEVCELVDDWKTLTPREQGERSGYIFGKYGGDILISGLSIRILAHGIRGAKRLAIISKQLKVAHQTFALEGLSASAESGTSFSELVKMERSAKALEGEALTPNQQLLKEKGLLDSYFKFKNAEEFLKQFQGRSLPETQVRELIHQQGIPTFPRPEGIPENYLVQISDDGAGIKYVDPKNNGTYVRVMPGKPHSPFPHQQKPYVKQQINGRLLDKNGNFGVTKRDPESHISLNEFKYKG